MNKVTREKFNEYLNEVARLNGVSSARERFAVAPTIQQKLEERIQLSSEFLKSINVIGVQEQEGAKVGMNVSGPIASRTNTANGDRMPRDMAALDQFGYRCEKTNFDSFYKYAQLDAWGKFPNFQTMLRDAIVKRQALDRIMIGFNGRSVATATDIVANPLLQDVNKGWLQQFRDNAPARVMSEVVAASKAVKVGSAAGHDYLNLDALVFDALNHLIDPAFQDDANLVVLCGRRLMADKYFPILNQNQRPEDLLMMDMLVSQRRIGGLQGIQVPFMPDGTLLITSLNNLSIYWQEGTRRRTILDNAKRDAIENYESSNEAYVVEDFRAGCVVENIQIV